MMGDGAGTTQPSWWCWRCGSVSVAGWRILRSPAVRAESSRPAGLAVGETVILLHPPLPFVGVSIVIEKECQQNDSLANG